MITFKHVAKDYGHGRWALRHIQLSIPEGEMCFLTGHSGAGKSTLLKVIMGLTHITQGQANVMGFNLAALRRRHIPKLRRHIGTVFQTPELIANQSIYHNVALPLLIHGMRYPEIAKRVRPALDMVGLRDKERCFPASLSSGEQQRVGIARAIVHKPKLLLADEPTGNLDPQLSLDIMRLFERFNQVGVTVLIATHDVGLVQALPHRTLTLKAGQIIEDSHAQ